MVVSNTKVVQVTNIAPQATKDQMQTLFGYLGKIEDIRLYPTIRDVSCPVQSRICYVKFVDSSTVGIAQHMTNTVFIDRALIVIPVQGGEIPDEYYALEMTRNGTIVPGLNVNEPKLPPHVTNNVQGTGSEAVIQTIDPQLETNELPPYPPLPVNYDSVKIEETRRTILVRNIDTTAISIDDFIQYLNTNAGEVKYVRLCDCPTDNTQHLLVEFTDQSTIIPAIKLNGQEFKGKTLEITHSIQSIVKPQAKSNEAAQKEIEEAMSRFKEAQNMISASIEPVIGMLTKDKRSSRRSRSRSPRDRDRDRDRRRSRRSSRSRSKSRRRSRSRRRRSTSRTRKSRSRERDRRSKRSKSHTSRKRSRSRSARRSRSRRSRSTARRSRSKSVVTTSKRRNSSRHRSKSRGKSHDRKSRDRSRDRKRDRKSSKDKESSSSSLSRKSKEKSSRESKDKKNDKESSVEETTTTATTKKRSRSRSHSHHRRSRSKDRKKDKDRKRSRSRDRRSKRSPSPPPRTSRKRNSRSRSRDRKKEKKERKDKKDRSRSRSKLARNYDEEEKGFDTEKEKNQDKEQPDSVNEKDSSEKSDNMDISNSP